MAPISKGFIIGYETLSYLTVYNLVKEEKLIYHKSYKFNCDNFQKVISMQTGPDDGYVAFTVLLQTKYMANFIEDQVNVQDSKSLKSEIYMFNLGIVDVINTTLRHPFEAIFPKGVHKGKIIEI